MISKKDFEDTNWEAFYAEKKERKSTLIFSLLFVFIISLGYWFQNNFYSFNNVIDSSSKTDLECEWYYKEFYEERGYILRWVDGKNRDLGVEYVKAESKWSFPFFSHYRYDKFSTDSNPDYDCEHLEKLFTD